MKYLKHKDYPKWVVMVSPYMAVTVWELDITHSQHPKHFLDSEDFIPATREEFLKSYNQTIEELNLLIK